MVVGRLNRESNPVPGEKPGFKPQHKLPDGSFIDTGEINPLPTKDDLAYQQLDSLKQLINDQQTLTKKVEVTNQKLSVEITAGHDYKILEHHVIAVEKSGNKVFGKKGTDETLLFKSLDNGDTWTQVATVLEGIVVGHYTSAGVLILFDKQKNIIRSTDDGATFTTVKTNVRSPLVNGIDSNGGDIIFGEYTDKTVDTSAHLYKSSDGGATWNIVLEVPVSLDETLGIYHFHTVKFLLQVGSRWFATTGDLALQSRIYESVTGNSGTWIIRGQGTDYRTVGLAAIPHRTLVWGADNAVKNYVYAGVFDELSSTKREISPLQGHTLGIAGGASVLMIVTRTELNDANGDLLSRVYVSYDSGASWQIEYHITQKGFSGFNGILGSDRKGNFYISVNKVESVNDYITVKATPKKGYDKEIKGISSEFTKRNITFPIFVAQQIRVVASVAGTRIPNNIYNYTIEVRNTQTDAGAVPLSVRVRFKYPAGHIKDKTGQILEFNLPSSSDGAVFLTKDDLKLECLPKDTQIYLYYSTLPANGDVTINIRGTDYIPTDHRIMETKVW